jgi:hypothetical protein
MWRAFHLQVYSVIFAPWLNLRRTSHQRASSQQTQKQRRRKDRRNSLLHHPLNTIKAHLQRLHLRAVTKAHKVMARAIKQIPPLARIQVEKNTGHDNDALLETGLEEVQPVGDGVGEALEIQPQVEGRVWDGLDVETD